MSQEKNKKIGFIGLGLMGKPMALNIAKANFPLMVYDVREEPLAELAKLGAKVAKSAKEVGRESDIVVVMVSSYSQVKEAAFPPEGALGGMRSGSTLIITSTILPREVEEVEKIAKQSGVVVIDSPVSGGTSRAEEGTLTFMVGGDEEAMRNSQDVLQAMGQHIYHVGKVGQGQAVKIINQILVSANIVSVAEAMVMAKKLGLNLHKLVDIISNSGGDSSVFRKMAPQMIAGDFTTKAAVNLFTKDTGIIMKTGLELEVPLPISSISYQVWRMAEARGLGQQDASVLVKVLGEIAGVKFGDG
jgi:3-hydroxyisobutyrate dehydrogenase-like beta-hydroxyacid dehydrogenase